MNGSSHDANLIGCSAKELRDIKEYIRWLERELHTAVTKLERQRGARSLRLARALREVRTRPLNALMECWRIVREPRGRRAATQRTPKQRSFSALDRRVLPPVAAIAGSTHRTVLAEIVERCGAAPIITLSGCEPSAPVADERGAAWHEVGPYDYELRLAGVERPTLLIDPAGIGRSSPWFGVFDVQDMPLNLAMASLLELVRSRRGRVVFARVTETLEPPLLRDFRHDALVVESLDAFIAETLPR